MGSFHRYVSLLSEVLNPKCRSIKTQAVRKLYGVYCLTGHVFKGVQRQQHEDDVENIRSPLSLAYPDFCVGS